MNRIIKRKALTKQGYQQFILRSTQQIVGFKTELISFSGKNEAYSMLRQHYLIIVLKY